MAKKGKYVEPNIWRKPNGNYLAVVNILKNPDSEGVRHRAKPEKTFASLPEARAWVEDQKAMSTLKLHKPGGCPSIADIVEMSYPERKRLASYPQLTKYHKRFVTFFGDTPIDSIKRPDIIRFKNWLGTLKKESKGDGCLSEPTQTRHIAELRNLLNWAERSECPENFRAPNMERICLAHRNPRPLEVSLKDIWAVIHQIATMEPSGYGGRWREFSAQAALVAIGINTGARLKDVTRMEKTRFNRLKRIFLCRNSKAFKDYIEIQVLEDTLKILDQYFRAHPENDTKYLVVNPFTSKPFVCIKKSMDRAIREVSCGRFTFHNLKHASVTALVEITGGDLDLVHRITGTSRATLQDWYAHLADRHVPVFEKLEERTRIAVGQNQVIEPVGQIIRFPRGKD